MEQELGASRHKVLKIARWWFQIFFIFIPTWGRFPFWLNIFQMGWNHQLDWPLKKDLSLFHQDLSEREMVWRSKWPSEPLSLGKERGGLHRRDLLQQNCYAHQRTWLAFGGPELWASAVFFFKPPTQKWQFSEWYSFCVHGLWCFLAKLGKKAWQNFVAKLVECRQFATQIPRLTYTKLIAS